MLQDLMGKNCIEVLSGEVWLINIPNIPTQREEDGTLSNNTYVLAPIGFSVEVVLSRRRKIALAGLDAPQQRRPWIS
jgi:hypothetical protein